MISEAELEEEIIKDTIEISDPLDKLRMEIQHLPIDEQYRILLTEKRNIYQREIENQIREHFINGNLELAKKLQHRLDKWIKKGRPMSVAMPKNNEQKLKDKSRQF